MHVEAKSTQSRTLVKIIYKNDGNKHFQNAYGLLFDVAKKIEKKIKSFRF